MTVDNACDSAILRAIADKLIPGIAPATRISMLQQTTFQEQQQQQEEALPDLSSLAIDKSSEKSLQQSALQYVIESDTYRNGYLREVAGPIPRSSFTHAHQTEDANYD